MPAHNVRNRKSNRIPEAVSLQQAAEILDVCDLTIRRWIRRGFIRAFRVGPQLVRIPRSEIARMRDLRMPYVVEGDVPPYQQV